MSWTNKDKIETETPAGYIVTPDLNLILVGSSEDLTLIYQEFSSEWGNKAKIEGPWTNKAKIDN